MHKEKNYLGIDFGTSGCRACVINENDEVALFKSILIKNPTDPTLWRESAFKLIQSCVSELPVNSIHSIAIDGTSSTLLLTDSIGQLTSEVLLYNDNRAKTQAITLAAIVNTNSATLSASSSLAKLLYLNINSNEKNQYALHQADWITAQLSGKFGVSDYNNCLKLGFDPKNLTWETWISKLPLEKSLFPKVLAPGDIISLVLPSIAEELGLSLETKIVAGTTDSTAAAWACGLNRAGDAMSSLGSTLVVKIVSDRPICSPEFGVYSHRFKNRYLVGGASNSGGTVLNQFFTLEEIKKLSKKIDFENPLNLNFYPLPKTGERFPINNSDLKPVVEPRPDKPEMFLQALLEGITSIEKQAYEKLEQLGAPKVKSIKTTGGGSNNRKWMQFREKSIGVSIIQAQYQEAAYGSALIAKLHTQI